MRAKQQKKKIPTQLYRRIVNKNYWRHISQRDILSVTCNLLCNNCCFYIKLDLELFRSAILGKDSNLNRIMHEFILL